MLVRGTESVEIMSNVLLTLTSYKVLLLLFVSTQMMICLTSNVHSALSGGCL